MPRRSHKSNEDTCLLSKVCHAKNCGCFCGERSSTSSGILKTGRTSRRSYGPGLFTPRCFNANCSITEAEELRSQSIYSCFKELDRLENIIDFARHALSCTSLPDKTTTMQCLEILETINFSRIPL